MERIVDVFKNISGWISEKMKVDGMRHTVVNIILSVMVIGVFMFYNSTVIENIRNQFHEQTIEQAELHQEQYLASREMYASVKQILKAQRPVTKADYILFLEYHNGSENIATGYQFCKFDVTLEVLSDTVPYIVIDDFRDENLYKYDILLSDQVAKSKISSFSLAEVQDIDRNLHHMLNPNDHTQYIVFYNVEHNGMIAGTLMFMFKDSDIDYRSVTNCAHDVENVINESISHHEEFMNEKLGTKDKRSHK